MRLLKTNAVLLFIIFGSISAAQEPEISTSEILESAARTDESAIDRLDITPPEGPLPDLNRMTETDLEALHLLSAAEIQVILNYRKLFGAFLSKYELQALPEFSLERIKILLEYVSIKTPENTRTRPWWEGFYRGKNDVVFRKVERGYLPPGSEGRRTGGAFRIRHTSDGRVRWGLTIDQDPGEAIFAGSNPQGFDFYSAYVLIQPGKGPLQTFLAGDYSVRIGQGLLLYNGFAPGKSAEIASIVRGGAIFQPYSAFGEYGFFRGIAFTIKNGKHWEWSGAIHAKRSDANVGEDSLSFTSFLYSGLHRTPAERLEEDNLKERLIMARGGWVGSNLQVHLNLLAGSFSNPWEPLDVPYRRFAFRGRNFSGLSLNYQFRKRNWYFLGENALDGRFTPAATNGFVFMPDRRVSLTVLTRVLPAGYQAVFAKPVVENTAASNEYGCYLGVDIKPNKFWTITAFGDLWRHPWLRYGTSGSTGGFEALVRVIWTPTKLFSVYGLAQSKWRGAGAATETQWNQFANIRQRIHVIWQLTREISCKTRLEWQTAGNSRGFAAFQEVVFKKQELPVSGSIRYTVFDTDDYDSRVYALERDIYASAAVAAVYGAGTRLVANLRIQIWKRVRLEARYEYTEIYRVGSESQKKGRVSGLKVQFRYQ